VGKESLGSGRKLMAARCWIEMGLLPNVKSMSYPTDSIVLPSPQLLSPPQNHWVVANYHHLRTSMYCLRARYGTGIQANPTSWFRLLISSESEPAHWVQVAITWNIYTVLWLINGFLMAPMVVGAAESDREHFTFKRETSGVRLWCISVKNF
jgi:hypothetical protein